MMIRRLSRLLPVLILGFAIIFSGHASAQSAEAVPHQAITVSPASSDISVDPGGTADRTLDIINGGNESFDVIFSVDPYHVEGANYDPKFTQLPGTLDASEWVKLGNTSDTVGGNKTVTIPFTVTVPKNTAPGGYYVVIFAETNTDNKASGVVSRNKVGSILYITVNGEVKKAGSLSGSPLPVFSFGGPTTIGAKISNSGGVHFVTATKYSVTDLSGNEVYRATAERYVLPQTEREIDYVWTPKQLIGVFTVHRSATIAGIEKTLPDQTFFMINPWLLLVIAFFIGILIGVPVQRARRRRQAKEK